MALTQPATFAGVTVPNAYHRIDRLVIEHKQSVFAYVNVYADAPQAAVGVGAALPAPKSFTFAWPKDAEGAPLAIPDVVAFAYTELLNLSDYEAAVSV